MRLILPEDEPSTRIGYTGNRLDRRGETRGDAAWAANQRARADARFLLFSGDKAIVSMRGCGRVTAALSPTAAAEFGIVGEPVLLGFEPEGAVPHVPSGPAPWFGATVAAAPEAIEASGIHKLFDMRAVVLSGAIDREEAGALAQARSLLLWHENHGFCAKCGAPTVMSSAGYRRDCPACGAQHFPRTDPVVIMLITRGDRCLLGRQARFAPGMYSCLAGFLEPGETIEDAVRRETFEEARIRVGRVGYFASQPWPFPSTLMIGMIGEALDETIVCDEAELEDCRWFSREEVRQMHAERHPDGLTVPKPIAIAHHLTKAFIEAE